MYSFLRGDVHLSTRKSKGKRTHRELSLLVLDEEGELARQLVTPSPVVPGTVPLSTLAKSFKMRIYISLFEIEHQAQEKRVNSPAV